MVESGFDNKNKPYCDFKIEIVKVRNMEKLEYTEREIIEVWYFEYMGKLNDCLPRVLERLKNNDKIERIKNIYLLPKEIKLSF